MLPTLLLSTLLSALQVPAPPAGPDLEPILAALRTAETLDDAMVGEDGAESETHRRFVRLRSLATPGQLLNLCRDRSAIVRCYALRALADAHEGVALLPILREHLRDTGEVTTFSGCIQARENAGDVMIETARPRLTEAQTAELAMDLVRTASPLEARGTFLRTLRFPDAFAPSLRALAEAGDSAALVALARFGLPEDLDTLRAALRPAEKLVDVFDALRAAEASASTRLHGALEALAPLVRRTLRNDAGYRARPWLAALVAQRTPAAAALLTDFTFSDSVPESRRRSFEDTLREVLDARPDPIFAKLRARLPAR